MFTSVESPYVGTDSAYLPQGSMPYDPYAPGEGTPILYAGDRVTIESVWARPYLDASAPLLYYVLSHTTGFRTHVTARDLYGVHDA